MKLKKLFALALAVCMVLSAAPVSMAGILSNGSSNGSTTGGILSNSNSNDSTGGILSSSTPAQQPDAPSSGNRGILSSNSGDSVYYTPSTLNNTEGGNTAPVVSTSTLDEGKKVESGEVFMTLTNDNDPPSGGAGLNTSPTNGLELKKTVSEAGDKITLEAWVTGQTVTVTQTTTKPMDIILVLDTSSEMIEGNDKTTRLNALKTAATTFINNVAAQTVAQGEQPTRIAIVKYNDTASVESGTKLAEEGALVFVNASGATELNGIVNALTIKENGAANCNLGLAHAKNIFQSANNGSYKDRDRVVILLSAGVFGSSGKLNTTNDYIAAMDTIWLSSILKLPKQYNVINDANTPVRTGKHSQKVYEITPSGSPYTYGIDFNSRYYSDTRDAAHTEADFTTLYCSGTNNSGYEGCGATVYCVGLGMPNDSDYSWLQTNVAVRINEVMYRVSSHRPDGTHVESGRYYNSWESGYWVDNYTDQRTRNHANGYFLTADNASNLNSIFESISSNVTTGGSSNESLTTETVVKDVISPYFQIPTDGTVTAYSVAYAGNNAWADTASKTYAHTITGNTVAVDGFNFSDNWVGINTATGKAHGQKLVIEIAIEPKDGFLGGQGIPTNDDTQAGVYLDNTLVENFPSSAAKTDIDIPNVTVDVKNKNVYLSNEMSDADMLSDAVVKIGDTVLDLHEENFGLEAWQYAFLREIKIVATEDTSSFNATCIVTDQAGNTKSGTDATAAQITVFKPVLTFKDSTIYLGQTPNYEEQNYGDPLVAWMHNNTNAETVTMTGGRPSLDVEFTEPKDFTVCRDISVKSVQLNGDGEYVDDTTVENGTKNYFTVHVVEPVAAFQDSTIYLGYTPNQNDFKSYNIKPESIGWEHTQKDGNAQPGDIQPEVKYSLAPTSDYNDCTTVKATVSSGGVVNSQGEREFTVHVLRPSLNVTDGYIYQGQEKTLTECVTLGDTWSDKDGCTAAGAIIVEKPEMDDFVFGFDQGDKFGPMECAPAAVKKATINGKDALSYFAEDDFTVHVLKPVFAVTTNDLWADFGTVVDLYKASGVDAVSAITYKWAYTGECEHPEELPDGAPAITVDEVVFNPATHTMTAEDATATVTGLTYYNELIAELQSAAMATDVAVTYPENADCVTLHVNKFDLTINKEWSGNAIYQQDAIFTVSGDQLGNVQVVLPAGQDSVTISGLLCGQDYTVTEANDWTWRWSATKTEGFECHSHAEVTTEAHEAHSTDVTFKNTLIEKIGELWLSFCTYVENIFTAATTTKGGN